MKDIRNFIEPLDTTPRILISDSIRKLSSLTNSSHDGVLVFDKQNKYKGITAIYHLLYKNTIPLENTIASFILYPPHFTVDSTIWDVMQAMISLHIYTLPLFDENHQLIGVIKAKRIIKELINDKQMFLAVEKYLRIKDIIITEESASIKDVYTIIRKGHKTRVIVVSKKGTLQGILSRRDIYLSQLSPAPDERYKKSGGKKPTSFFDRDWPKKLDRPVKTFMTRNVLTVSEKVSWKTIITKLISSDANTIVFVDTSNIPQGIISVRDILMACLESQPEKKIPIIITDRKKSLHAFQLLELEDLLTSFTTKISKKRPVKQVQLILDTIKQTKQSIKQFEVTIHVTLEYGKILRSKSKTYTLRKGVRESQQKIEKIFNRDH